MRSLTLAAVLFATPVLGAQAPPTPANVVREFVANNESADWLLDLGWTWSDGALTHTPGPHVGSARQVNMPSLTPGRQYRIKVRFANRNHGSVAVGFGGTSAPRYGENGEWTLLPVVTDPDAPLVFTASPDFDGVISGVTVVELGDELLDPSGWVLPEGWSKVAGGLRYAIGAPAIEQSLNLISGHTYRVYFGIRGVSDITAARGTVSLGASPDSFTELGDWNYAMDVEVGADHRLRLTPPAGDLSVETSDSVTLYALSVREILSEPVLSQTTPASPAQP